MYSIASHFLIGAVLASFVLFFIFQYFMSDWLAAPSSIGLVFVYLMFLD